MMKQYEGATKQHCFASSHSQNLAYFFSRNVKNREEW